MIIAYSREELNSSATVVMEIFRNLDIKDSSEHELQMAIFKNKILEYMEERIPFSSIMDDRLVIQYPDHLVIDFNKKLGKFIPEICALIKMLKSFEVLVKGLANRFKIEMKGWTSEVNDEIAKYYVLKNEGKTSSVFSTT